MTIQEIENTIIRGEKALVFPLKYSSGYIWDDAGHMVFMMRGWGYLQYHSGGEEKAAELQDVIAEWVVKTLNESHEK